MEQSNVNMESRMEVSPILREKMAEKGVTLESQLDCDVHFIINIDETIIWAHKRVLSFGNEVFKDMFETEDEDGQDSKFEVKNIKSPVFLALLRFLYSEKIDFSQFDIMELFLVAKHFGSLALQTECIAHMLKNLNDETAFTTLERATFLEQDKLRRICVNYIDDRATSIFLKDYSFKASLEALCGMLESDALNIKEIELFRAVERWSVAECERLQLPVNNENRRKVLGEALGSIRFTLIKESVFFGEVVNSPLLTDSEIRVLVAYYKQGQLPVGIYTMRERTEAFSSVIRFKGIESGWSEPYKKMAISFSVNRPITLVGVCFFGPTRPCEFTISYEIVMLKHPLKTIGGETLIIYTDGLPRVFPITFRSDVVRIEANQPYKILATIKRPSGDIDTFYGVNGQSAITERTREGSFDFKFTNPMPSESKTTIEEGQIPTLIFRKHKV